MLFKVSWLFAKPVRWGAQILALNGCFKRCCLELHLWGFYIQKIVKSFFEITTLTISTPMYIKQSMQALALIKTVLTTIIVTTLMVSKMVAAISANQSLLAALGLWEKAVYLAILFMSYTSFWLDGTSTQQYTWSSTYKYEYFIFRNFNLFCECYVSQELFMYNY